MEYESYYNNLHAISNYNRGKGFACNNGKLSVTDSSTASASSQEINDLIFNTLKWVVSKTQSKDELSCKAKIQREMCPGGPLEKVALCIDEIRSQIVGMDNQSNEFQQAAVDMHKLQELVLKKYESRVINNLNKFTDLWFDEEMPIVSKGNIEAADDPSDESGLQEAQQKVAEALRSIVWKFDNGGRLGLDLTQDLRNIDYGGKYDKTLFILEGMDTEKGKWISAEIRQEVQTLRKLQQEKIEQKIAWVETTCPALLESVKKMMVSRRIATIYSPFKNEMLKEVKERFAPEKPGKNIASTSFMIKTPKGEVTDLDIEKLRDVETQIELFAKPCLGEPDCYLSEVGLKYNDVAQDMGNLLPHTIDFAGFQPGQGAIRERVAYKLQEALGIDFGVPPIVILDANFKEFHLDDLATQLYEHNYLEEDVNPCYNPFTCFIKFIPDTQSLTDDNENLILPEEAHKPLINTALLNADGHLDNSMFKDRKLIMIDFGYGIPEVTESLDEIKQCKNLLMDMTVASQPISPKVREKLMQIDIDQVINIVKQDVELHKKQFGKRCALSEKSYNMLHLNLLLLKIGAELNKTPREIDAVQCPIRRRTNEKMTLHGGEYVSIYNDLILNKNEVDWDEAAKRLRSILNLPLHERSTTDRSYSSLRLRKIES